MGMIIEFLKAEKIEYKTITLKDIVFDESLSRYCKTNQCGLYNSTWICSSECKEYFNLERIYRREKVIFFSKFYQLRDSFDYEKMVEAKADFEKLLRKIIKIKTKDEMVFGPGGCTLCKECTYPHSDCRFPNLVIYPVEKMDIHVSATASKNGLKYNNGPNTVTYFSLIFLGENDD